MMKYTFNSCLKLNCCDCFCFVNQLRFHQWHQKCMYPHESFLVKSVIWRCWVKHISICFVSQNANDVRFLENLFFVLPCHNNTYNFTDNTKIDSLIITKTWIYSKIHINQSHWISLFTHGAMLHEFVIQSNIVLIYFCVLLCFILFVHWIFPCHICFFLFYDTSVLFLLVFHSFKKQKRKREKEIK